MMKLNVHFSPSQTDELYFTGKTTVVIDVLRATTTLVAALSNGAKEIIPVGSVEFAMKVTGNAFGGQTLLGGERNTKKIEGFHLGNSPSEYSREVVGGKSIILFTTNGSKAIVKAKFSEHLFLCSFPNIFSIARHLSALKKDVEIVCAGKTGSFCIEDSICAGKLIAELLKIDDTIELNDSSKAALILSKSYGKSILKTLTECEHGKLLVENGFENDIHDCAKYGTTDIVPFYSNGSIKPLNHQQHINEVQALDKSL